jgi:small subunit ribosomal protein S15
MQSQDKQQIIEKHGRKEGDSGSPEVQVALLTAKIAELTDHLRIHGKDNSSRRGLLAMVNRRRRLLRYLHRENPAKYASLNEELKLRRQF